VFLRNHLKSHRTPSGSLSRGSRQHLRALINRQSARRSGPGLIEPKASAQFLGIYSAGRTLRSRKPWRRPGRSEPFEPSESTASWARRVFCPMAFDVVDDPTQTESAAHSDRPLPDRNEAFAESGSLMKTGVLKEYLRSRQPIKDFRTDGHCRVSRSHGAPRGNRQSLIRAEESEESSTAEQRSSP